jgi:tetratricopeptide (TPR) repeat protein
MPMLLVGLTAFAIGAGAMWLALREKQPLAAQNSATRDTAETRAGEPPDVSHLAPADVAATLANWNYDRQNWSHAIDHYQEAIALGRDNPDVRTDLGNCFRFLGQPQKALEQYETAQRQNPQHENSLFNQGGLYAFSLNQPEKALDIWREYLARFPQSLNAPKTRELISEVEKPQSDQRSEVARWLKNRTQPTPTPSVR